MPLLPEVDPEQPYLLPPQEGATTGALAERIHRNKKLNALGYDVRADFGATGVGTAVLLSSVYGSLAAAQVVYPLAQSLSDSFDTVAIEQALNVAPARDSGYPPNDTARETAFATPILFGDGDYVATRPIVIPSTKSVTFQSAAPFGARIVYEGDGDWLFDFEHILGSPTLGRSVTFDGLVLVGGGVRVPPVNRQLTFRQCMFLYTPAPAIHFYDAFLDDGLHNTSPSTGLPVHNGGVGFDIFECRFYYCAGGVWDEAATFNIGRIRYSRFHANRHVPIMIDTTGVDVIGNDFIGVDANHGEYPFIWLRGDSYATAHIRIMGSNRFGSEDIDTSAGDGYVYVVPESAIVCGELGTGTPDPANDGRYISHITIADNDFMGVTGVQAEGSGTHALRLNCAMRSSSVSGRNQIKSYVGALVEEAWSEGFEEDEPEAEESIGGINTWAWQNVTHQNLTVPTFSRGGLGWVIDYAEMPFVPTNDLGRPGGNLINRSDDLTTWTQSNSSVAKDAVGPDGGSNTAWTLTRTSTGPPSSASVRRSGISVSGGELLVGSVWLKAGTEDICYINITENTARGLAPTAVRMVLTDQWVRYRVPAAPVQSGATSVAFTVYIGPKNRADTTGTILMAWPQLEVGTIPSRYTHNLDSTARIQQRNGLVLGDAIIGYGTAAPASGYHQVGDVVLNTVPASGQPMGWACSVAGSPGTWVAMPNYA